MSHGETKNMELVDKTLKGMVEVSIDNLVPGRNYLVQVNLGNFTRKRLKKYLYDQFMQVERENQALGFEPQDYGPEQEAETAVATTFIPDRIERARAVNFLVSLSVSEIIDAIRDFNTLMNNPNRAQDGGELLLRVEKIASSLGIEPASKEEVKNPVEYEKYWNRLMQCRQKLIDVRQDVNTIITSSNLLLESPITHRQWLNLRVAIFDRIAFLKPEQESAKWNPIQHQSGINAGFLALSTVPDGAGGFTFFEDNLPSFNMLTIGNWRENSEGKHSQTFPEEILGNINQFLEEGPVSAKRKPYTERRKKAQQKAEQKEQDFQGQESVEDLKARTKALHPRRGGRRKTKRRKKKRNKHKTKRRKKTKRKRIKKRKTKRKK
tara:strand:+ start:293 stop:1429 length:1137 start_codon:yes stop_codon:yes gene_type:complete